MLYLFSVFSLCTYFIEGIRREGIILFVLREGIVSLERGISYIVISSLVSLSTYVLVESLSYT